MPKQLTTIDFIERARLLHGDKYGYENSVYVNARTKVKIICPEHGGFLQNARNHLKGMGCRKCVSRANSAGLSSWMQRAAIVHGDRYDYSKSKYISRTGLIEIVCSFHGSFWQSACVHLTGCGCPECGKIRSDKAKTMSGIDFTDRASAIHEGKYDYSNVDYINSDTKVEIICPHHGSFFQVPHVHTRGSGCPGCACDYNRPTEIYLLSNGDQVKIGISLDINRRMYDLRNASPFKFDLVNSWTVKDHPTARSLESAIHKNLEACNSGLTGFDGATEWFNTSIGAATKEICRYVN